MIEETKKVVQIEEAKEPELSEQDLEQVTGGAATATTNQSRAARKASEAMQKFAGA